MISNRRITAAAGHRMPRVQRSPLEEEVHVSPASMTQKYSTLSPSLAVGIDEPDRNLALELVRVTEAAAIAGGHWVGFGDKTGPECDVAVDPIDGTRLTALGINNALAVLAVAERGSMFDPSAVFYM